MAWFNYLCLALLSTSLSVYAQPNPAQQKRISAAIKDAAHNKTIDWTQFVNPFIGEYINCNETVLSPNKLIGRY